MSTRDNDTLHRFYDAITVGSKRFSGIVGDAAHAATGGYHIGRDYVPRSDYSAGYGGLNASPRDRNGDGQVSCAIDVTFDPADMATVTRRLLAAAGTDVLRGVREFNGTVDGRSTLNRDAVLGWRQNYTPDPTHLWHVHIGFFRDTAQDWSVLSDVTNVINGTTDQEDFDMPFSTWPQSEKDGLFNYVWGGGKIAVPGGYETPAVTLAKVVDRVNAHDDDNRNALAEWTRNLPTLGASSDPTAVAAALAAALPADLAKQVADELGKRLAAPTPA